MNQKEDDISIVKYELEKLKFQKKHMNQDGQIFNSDRMNYECRIFKSSI